MENYTRVILIKVDETRVVEIDGEEFLIVDEMDIRARKFPRYNVEYFDRPPITYSSDGEDVTVEES